MPETASADSHRGTDIQRGAAEQVVPTRAAGETIPEVSDTVEWVVFREATISCHLIFYFVMQDTSA